MRGFLVRAVSLAYQLKIPSTTLERTGLIDLRVPSGSADAEPPLSALIYAAQGILYPTLSFNHIPDLLDILSQVERVREFLREHAKWALIWQRFYETRPNPNVRVLQKSDKDLLKRVLKPERLDATRRIFICIVEHVIRMVRPIPLFLAFFCLLAVACALYVDTCRGVISSTPLPPNLLPLGPRETQQSKPLSSVVSARRRSASC